MHLAKLKKTRSAEASRLSPHSGFGISKELGLKLLK
jgi:hypothetical protein